MSAALSFAGICLSGGKSTFEGRQLSLHSLSFELLQFFVGEEVVVAGDADVEVGEESAVLAEVIRNVVRFEEIIDAFVDPVLALEIGDLFDQVEGK